MGVGPIRNRELEADVIRFYYEAWLERGPHGILFDQWGQQDGRTLDAVHDAVFHLSRDGVLDGKGYAQGSLSTIQILDIEGQRKVPDDLISEAWTIRDRILTAALSLEETGQTWPAWGNLLAEAGLDQQEHWHHVEFLKDTGFIREGPSTVHAELTDLGRGRALDQRHKSGLREEYRRLKECEGMTRQARGRALELLVAKICEADGWNVAPRQRAHGEEIDVVLWKGREYYALSAKWEAEPVGDDARKVLFDSLRKRAGVDGILLSMSGFTEDLIHNLEADWHDRKILVFGPLDAEDLLLERRSLGDLLDLKIQALVNNRRALVDGEPLRP